MRVCRLSFPPFVKAAHLSVYAPHLARIGKVGAKPLPENGRAKHQIRIMHARRAYGRKIRLAKAFHTGNPANQQDKDQPHAAHTHHAAGDKQQHLPHPEGEA